MNSEKKHNFKQCIDIQQHNNHVKITGSVNDPAYEMTDLYFTNDENKVSVCVPNQDHGSRFRYEINIETELNELAQTEGVYRLDMTVQVHKDYLTEKQLAKLKAKATTNVDETTGFIAYPIRLGRFAETITSDMKPAVIDGETFALYKTIKGNLSLAVNKPVTQKFETKINTMNAKKNIIQFTGCLLTQTFEMEKVELLVAGRDDNRQQTFPVNIDHLQEETNMAFGLNRYEYTTSITLDKMFEGVEEDSNIYDVFFKVTFFNQKEPTLIKIGKPTPRARSEAKMVHTTIEKSVFAVNIYYSYKMSYLSLQVEDFEKNNYKYLKRLMRWAFLLRPFYKKKDIWIIGELKYKGQDTGYHFFKYVRTEHPEKNAYYIIDEHSPDRKNVEPYGNVLFFKSKDHIKATIFANKIIGSHHAHFFYPLRTDAFKNKLHAQIIFLQHGVLGIKNLSALYSKRSKSLGADLMIVSSDKEKEIAMRDFGYKEKELAVTGLSRFDRLFQDDIPVKRQLLIIPTWREWLLQESVFLESEYLKRYRELIFHPRLKELAETYDFEVVFCLHPNMQHFTRIFNDIPHRVVSQGEVSVQDLLKESTMMITDYSSVAFDFSFLEKPIVYYQFDRKRFLGKAGAHLDLDKDLPGDIVFDVADVLQQVAYYAKNDFHMKHEHQEKASEFLKYKDRKSSERIYERVDQLKVKRRLPFSGWKRIAKKIYRRFIARS